MGRTPVLPVSMFSKLCTNWSLTDNRIGAVIITVEPKAPGPPMHWHRMHDETFLILTGTVRFLVSDEHGVTKEIDARAGDYVVVPPKSIHAFCNVTDEPARCVDL